VSSDLLPDVDCQLLLEQQIRYTYDRPIRHLHHRLIVIPRALHGAQVRTDFAVSASLRSAQVTVAEDAFSNCVVHVVADEVADEIEFSIRATVTPQQTPAWSEPRSCIDDPRFILPTSLANATMQMVDVGQEFAATGASPAVIGEMACRWAHRALRYGFGVTDVHTTAAAALLGGTGVCQDYAHIMIAVCRSAGVPTRYVSGHLIGEGGSHAWVEVLHAEHPGGPVTAIGFDPTHDRHTDARYLTIAVGRDYSDVAPTSGRFKGRARGALHVDKRVTGVAVLALASRDNGEDCAPCDL
jgi:transglutaminase-like putative cysteine protease